MTRMKTSVLYAIIAVIVVGAGGGIAFAAMSMNGTGALDPPNNSQQTRTIEHAMGTTEITGVAERIVVLEWTYAEDLLVLGVQPVGVADIAGMNKWVQMKEFSLSPDVVDVGTRQQPNLEKISELDPDLIIAPQFRIQEIYGDLSAIAPTLAFNPYPPEEQNLDHMTEMEQTLMTIADIVGRHDAGVAAIERMNESFERAAQKISSAGKGEEFLVVQAYTNANNDAAEMRIFTANSIPAQIMNRLGLENAWDVKYELYGFSTVGLESLVDVDHVNFFYVVQDDDNVFANEWDNPVWQNLEFVKEGRTYSLGGDTWLFGGPVSAEIFAEKVAGALAGDSETTRVSHAMGETTITGTPKRIVAMGPEFVEHLVALGIEPAGIVETETLRLWYPEMSQQLSSNVVDLGDYPPNLEAIAELQPDLILGGPGLYSEFYGDLESIAPTIMFDLFPGQSGPTQLERMEETHMTIAGIVDRQDRAAANLECMHAKFDEAADKLDSAGLAGSKFIYVEAGVWQESPWMNVYAENAELSIILEEVGLENTVGDDVEFDNYGFVSSSLEGLSALDGPDVYMFYTTALGSDVFNDSDYWAENPVWTNLEFVKADRVYNLHKVYAFAGPLQAELLVDKVVELLTNR